MICKDFLHLFGCLVLHCFLEARLIYSSVTETKEVQRTFMKVGTANVCSLSCQFYYTHESLRTLAKKKAMHRYIDLTVETYEEYFKTFIVLQRRKRQTKIDGCRCEGGAVGTLDLTEVINE